MYQRPYTIEEIRNNYPDKAEALINDPVHLWRANSGIELIHQEPTLEEQERIWKNWNEMTQEMKEESDRKCREFFGKSNSDHNIDIMNEWRADQ